MADRDLDHVLYVTFYIGPQPQGSAHGAPKSVTFGDDAPLLPAIGSLFLWKDQVGGTELRGRVAEAGVVEMIDNGSTVTVVAQVDCVASQMTEAASADVAEEAEGDSVGSDPVDAKPES